MSNPIYDQLAANHPDVDMPAPVTGLDSATAMLPAPGIVEFSGHTDVVLTFEPPSRTAGEQDHSDPWQYAGADAAPPGNP